jgi:PKD repeat protein
VAVSASADFPVKTGLTAVANGGPGPVVGGAPNAAFSADDTISPNVHTVIGPTATVEFRDTSGGAPDAWEWDFADGTTSNLQDPLDHTFDCSFSTCSYVVTMKASNLVGSTIAQMTVVVIGDSDVNFTATAQSGTAPLAVTFTEAATPGGDTYEWDFGDGNTATGKSASHTYNSVGKFDVTLTVTYPDPVGKKQAKKAAYIEVAVGDCTVPQLSGIGLKFDDAQAVWTGAGFSGTVSRSAAAPKKGNFTITSQSIVYPDVVPCSTGVEVSGK